MGSKVVGLRGASRLLYSKVLSCPLPFFVVPLPYTQKTTPIIMPPRRSNSAKKNKKKASTPAPATPVQGTASPTALPDASSSAAAAPAPPADKKNKGTPPLSPVSVPLHSSSASMQGERANRQRLALQFCTTHTRQAQLCHMHCLRALSQNAHPRTLPTNACNAHSAMRTLIQPSSHAR